MTDHSRTSSLEFVLGSLGAAVVLAVLAFLTYQAVVADSRGAELSASVTKTERSGNQHVVHYQVRNDGSRTAEQVHVVGELVNGGRTMEHVSSTIPYVPVGSTRHGVLVFSQEPTKPVELRVRAVSYTTP